MGGKDYQWTAPSAATPPAPSTPASDTRSSSTVGGRALPAGFDSAHMKKFAEGLILLAAEQRKTVDAEQLLAIRDALAGKDGE